ncbi:MAG: discoidin domain-containing protein [Candidatus Zixiibacteriota bacterium]
MWPALLPLLFAACGGAPAPVGDFSLTADSLGEIPMPSDARRPENLAKAQDGSMATRWTTGANMEPGHFVELEFPEPRRVAGLTLDAGTAAEDFPARFVVEVSAGGTDWKEAFAGGPDATKGGLTRVKFRRAEEVKYILITVSEAKDRWWSIYEIEVEYADDEEK